MKLFFVLSVCIPITACMSHTNDVYINPHASGISLPAPPTHAIQGYQTDPSGQSNFSDDRTFNSDAENNAFKRNIEFENGTSTQQVNYSSNNNLSNKSICLQRYQIALNECQNISNDERDSARRSILTASCLRKSNFPNGMDSCN